MSTYSLRVQRKQRETADCASLWLDVPTDLRGAFDHRPGQFITINATISGEDVTRQYSLSSLPSDPDGLRITVKKIPGGRMSTWLVDDAKEGDLIEVAPPRGMFFKPLQGAHRVILLAAGSGIAPILPIARKLLSDGAGHRVILAYGSRTLEEIILRGEVDQLPDAFRTFTLEHILSRPQPDWTGAQGRIDPAYLRARQDIWAGDAGHLPLVIYLCGPEFFMDAGEAYFLSHGVDASSIRRESFDLVLNDDSDEPPLLVCGTEEAGETSDVCEELIASVAGEETRIVPEPNETILAALIRAEAPVPFSCQEGTCSSCIAKIKQGSASVRPGVLKTLRQDDLNEGLLLACLARPTTKRVLIDFDDI